MPDTPHAAQRRIRWIVALIIFLLALGALYMVLMRHHPHHPGPSEVNVVSPTS